MMTTGTGGTMCRFILSVAKAILYAFQVALWFGSLPWALLADVLTYRSDSDLLCAGTPAVSCAQGVPLRSRDDRVFRPDGGRDRGRTDLRRDARRADLRRRVGCRRGYFPGLDGHPALSEEPHRDDLYPRLHPGDEYKHPWAYPLTEGPEKATTSAGPFPRGADPTCCSVTCRRMRAFVMP